MRAVWLKQFGPPDVLVPGEAPDPIAAAGQVVVACEFLDAFERLCELPILLRQLPAQFAELRADERETPHCEEEEQPQHGDVEAVHRGVAESLAPHVQRQRRGRPQSKPTESAQARRVYLTLPCRSVKADSLAES